MNPKSALWPSMATVTTWRSSASASLTARIDGLASTAGRPGPDDGLAELAEQVEDAPSDRWVRGSVTPTSRRERTKGARPGALRRYDASSPAGLRGGTRLRSRPCLRRAWRGAALFGLVHDDGLGGEEQGGDRGGVLQRRPGHLDGVDDAGLEQVLVLAGGGVEALVGLLQVAHLVDDDATLEAGVDGDLLQRLLDGPGHDAGTGGLVTLQLLGGVEHGGLRPEQGDATAGDDALLDGGLGGGDGVLDAVLLLLELHLGGGADLDDGNAAGQLGQALLQLLPVVVGVGVLDLGLDLVDPALDVVSRSRRPRPWWSRPWSPRPCGPCPAGRGRRSRA